MTDHTPGPWTTTTDHYRWADNNARLVFGPDPANKTPIAAAGDFNRYDRDAEVDANARLIAAAPDLLAALQAALEQTDDGLHQDPCDEPDCWVMAAQRAILKTRGKAAQP